jgi:hypothetical protein
VFTTLPLIEVGDYDIVKGLAHLISEEASDQLSN